ncbi:MAG: hypothetical protein WDM76_05125 [Limisphaerales bacterium]
MKPQVYLAIDLGAESGRVIAGIWNGKKLRLEEIHRFSNGPVCARRKHPLGRAAAVGGNSEWPRIGGKKFGKQIVSVGADTWGVDFVLLNQQEEILGLPYHYRDARTRGALERAFKRVPRAGNFCAIRPSVHGTEFALSIARVESTFTCHSRHGGHITVHAGFFSLGNVRREKRGIYHCLHVAMRSSRYANWSLPMLKQFGLPTHFLPKIVPPGTVLGKLRTSLAERTGLVNTRVIAPPSHDTASAVAGVPTANTGKANWAYISSGTWSLMGVEVKQAALSRARWS